MSDADTPAPIVFPLIDFALRATETGDELAAVPSETSHHLETISQVLLDLETARALRKDKAACPSDDDMLRIDSVIENTEEALAELERLVERVRVDMSLQENSVRAQSRLMWVMRDRDKATAALSRLTVVSQSLRSEIVCMQLARTTPYRDGFGQHPPPKHSNRVPASVSPSSRLDPLATSMEAIAERREWIKRRYSSNRTESLQGMASPAHAPSERVQPNFSEDDEPLSPSINNLAEYIRENEATLSTMAPVSSVLESDSENEVTPPGPGGFSEIDSRFPPQTNPALRPADTGRGDQRPEEYQNEAKGRDAPSYSNSELEDLDKGSRAQTSSAPSAGELPDLTSHSDYLSPVNPLHTLPGYPEHSVHALPADYHPTTSDPPLPPLSTPPDPSETIKLSDEKIAKRHFTTTADWEKFKDVIHEKYIKEGYTLHELITYMKENHSFAASASQYKSRLIRWNFKKHRSSSKQLQTESLRYNRPSIQSKGTNHMTSQAGASPRILVDVAPTDSGYASMGPNKKVCTSDPENTTWETSTIYSVASVETTTKETIVQNFVNRLFSDMGGQRLDDPDATALMNDLPDLLAEFALRLGQRCSKTEIREAMVFIHKYRIRLSESMRSLIMSRPDEEDSPDPSRLRDEMSIEDKMRMWRNNLDQDQVEPVLDATENDIRPDELGGIEELDKYTGIVVEDCSYTWLLGKLQNQALLTNDRDGIMSSIRRNILYVLPKTTELRSRSAPVFRAMFEVSWPLRSFLIKNFVDSDRVDVGQVMTITGSIRNAQALTCEQYMEQTWPSTGIHLLLLLQKIMTSPIFGRGTCQRPDGAILEAWERDTSTICVTVVGTGGVAAELAEQLSWLSAALKEVPESKRFVTSTPWLHCATVSPDQYLSKLEERQRVKQTQVMQNDSSISAAEASYSIPEERYYFQIGAELEEIHFSKAQGLCWNQMVHKSIIVRGFPIRHRPRMDLGLEISLKVAAELVGTKYVNRFESQLFVKGYSAMLTPTLQVGEVLVWHLSVSPPGEHLSYHNHDTAALQDIEIQDIDKFRHVVGWCSRALNYAGAADSHYAVRRARLPKADAGCALVNNVISFGVLLTSEASSVLSTQHPTTHAQRTGYLDWFRYLSQNFVLFWDKRDQRGWLVNGISALLHLVRASLSADERNFAGSDFVWKPSDLQEPRQPHSAKAPREFFSQRENREAKISLRKMRRGNVQDEYEILDDRMEQYCHVLEKAITYSEKLQVISPGTAKGKSAFRLEGWDFVDLVEKVEAVNACTTILPNVSHAWLELVRSNGITTFFGQGFGELITPSSSSCCEDWMTLPTGKHYIAANVADIQQIMELRGDPDSKPRYLSETLMWHHPATAFEHCGCQEPGERKTKLIQQPCSTQKICVCPDLYHPDFNLEKYETGAVIFGYNPEYGPLPDVENEDHFDDSGIGSSLTETMTQSSSSVQPARPNSSMRQYGNGNVSGGTAHFGDTNVQYIYNYTMPPSPTQQSASSFQRLGSPYLATGESTETKRGHPDVDTTSSLAPE